MAQLSALWHGHSMIRPDTYLPAEWQPHDALWVGWPHLREEWGDAFEGARDEIAAFVDAAKACVPVCVACGSDEAEISARKALGQAASLVRIPAGDIWLRDTGPIIAVREGALQALCFAFNGWGGKYLMPGDRETAAAMAAHLGLPSVAHDYVLEGGAIEVDGAGCLLTTRQCLLNPNRNPGWDDVRAENALKTAFGIDRVVWLEAGLANDHTDGHVDNIARFVALGHVVCQAPSGDDDPNADTYRDISSALRAAGLTVTTLPSPGRIADADGAVLPASHMNFTVTNGAVILPTYEDVYSQQAVDGLRDLFPQRRVLALPARHILAGGGSFHCMTREIPRFPHDVGDILP